MIRIGSDDSKRIIVRLLHKDDLAKGHGRVYLPYALEKKYPNANAEWGWQYVFPARSLSKDPGTGEIRRHHVHESAFQKAVKVAARSAGHRQVGQCPCLPPLFCHTPFGSKL